MKPVFDQYYRKLVYYAMGIVGDMREAEEIVSDALRKAWQKRNTLETPMHLNNFLYRVVKNACISLLRTRKVEDRRQSELRELQSDESDENAPFDVDRARAEALSRIWQDVALHVGQKDADMLRLRFEGDLSDAEIAGLHQTNKDNVRLKRKRALDKLRKVFGKDRYWVLILLLTNGLR
jgi:RNA polymerase sigma-70 factor (ECF subfamily)